MILSLWQKKVGCSLHMAILKGVLSTHCLKNIQWNKCQKTILFTRQQQPEDCYWFSSEFKKMELPKEKSKKLEGQIGKQERDTMHTCLGRRGCTKKEAHKMFPSYFHTYSGYLSSQFPSGRDTNPSTLPEIWLLTSPFWDANP